MPSHRQRWGWKGEEYAVKMLESWGWKVCARQYRTPFGEIDIIAEDPEGWLVFLEVKARTSYKYGLPEESVTSRKLRKIARSLWAYLAKEHQAFTRYRVDVLALDVFPGKPIVLRHFVGVGVLA